MAALNQEGFDSELFSGMSPFTSKFDSQSDQWLNRASKDPKPEPDSCNIEEHDHGDGPG